MEVHERMDPTSTIWRELLKERNEDMVAIIILPAEESQFLTCNTSWRKQILKWRSWERHWVITIHKILSIIRCWRPSSLLSRNFCDYQVTMLPKNSCRLIQTDWHRQSITHLAWRCTSLQEVLTVNHICTNSQTTSQSYRVVGQASHRWVIQA